MKNKLIFIVSILIIIQCKNNKEYLPYKPIEKLQPLINYKNFDDIFRSRKNIQLDTSDYALLGVPSKQSFIDDSILIISDNSFIKSVKKFKLNGNYLNDIGKLGEGPGEFKIPSLITATREYILIYDNTLSKLIIYNSTNNLLINEFKLKYQYYGLQIYNNDILFLRYDLLSKDEIDIIIDVYSFAGKLKLSKTLLTTKDSKKLLYLPKYNNGFEIYDNKLYFIASNDFRIQCVLLKNMEIIWQSLPLKKNINLPSLPQENNLPMLHKWADEHSILLEMLIFNNGLILVRTFKNAFLFDENGNYLTTINDIKTGPIFTNRYRLYSIGSPDFSKKLSNYSIKEYEFKDIF